jgi:serine/threonine-protein kinase
MSIPKTIGRYVIVGELGSGAMGSVFRAHDPAMDRIVALKTILAGALAGEQSSLFRQRFFREARAAGALAHPGIVPVFDVGEDDGVPFLVMEFVNGQTLADAMKKGERPSLDRICEIGQQIAEALGYAHRNGVIHRDIKPANILLTSRETYGAERPRITDFGVAKLAAAEITTTGQLLGTPAFMPPEQFTGSPVDGRADLFSLGVMLYWMATGEQPFSGETMTAVSYKIVHTEPIPPAKLNPAIPAQFERVILKCLAKNPADRYQTCEELAQVLAQVLAKPQTDAKVPVLFSAAPPAAIGGAQSEETIFAIPSTLPKPIPASAPATPAQPLQTTAPAPAAKKQSSLIFAGAVLVAVAAAGGYLLLHRSQAAQHQPAPAPMATAAPQPAQSQQAAPAQTPQAPSPQPPAPSAVVDTTPAPAPAVAKKPVAPPAAPSPNRSRTAAVAFDPRTLPPNQNARLKIDLESFPPGLAFTVEMNGKTYYKGSTGSNSDYGNLFVPPGVHEFRVSVRGGSVQKISNTVSAEFLAKKHLTLRAELRTAAKNSSTPSPALDPSAQVVAILKADRFHL